MQNLSPYLALIAIVVSAAVGLSIAYMHRRQMRQIEMHKANSKVPLKPPPLLITKLFYSIGLYVFFFVLLLWTLVSRLTETGPTTRNDVFWIVLNVFGLVFQLALIAGTFVIKGMSRFSIAVLDALHLHQARIDGQDEIIRKDVQAMASLVGMLREEKKRQGMS